MAAFGAKYLKYARIAKEESGKLPTYEQGKAQVLGALVKADLTVNNANGELYADDKLTERMEEFANGSLAVEIDELEDETAVLIFGATLTEDGEKVDSTKDTIPNGGLCYYKSLLKNGKKFYRAYFYPKTKAVMGNDSAATKTSSITFATTPINFTVMEPETGQWRYTKKCDTEEEAIAWINNKLSNASETTIE